MSKQGMIGMELPVQEMHGWDDSVHRKAVLCASSWLGAPEP